MAKAGPSRTAQEALKILLPILQAMLEASFRESEASACASHAILLARRGASHAQLQPTFDHFLAMFEATIEAQLLGCKLHCLLQLNWQLPPSEEI